MAEEIGAIAAIGGIVILVFVAMRMLYGDKLKRFGLQLSKEGFKTELETHIPELLENKKNNSNNQSSELISLQSQAKAFLFSGNPRKGLPLINRALSIDSRNQHSFVIRSCIYEATREYQKALADLYMAESINRGPTESTEKIRQMIKNSMTEWTEYKKAKQKYYLAQIGWSAIFMLLLCIFLYSITMLILGY